MCLVGDHDHSYGANKLTNDQRNCRPWVERVAARATVATFEQFRLLAAASGLRCLHNVVYNAALTYVREIETQLQERATLREFRSNPSETFVERKAIVFGE